jgi:hypothetical protein
MQAICQLAAVVLTTLQFKIICSACSDVKIVFTLKFQHRTNKFANKIILIKPFQQALEVQTHCLTRFEPQTNDNRLLL